MKICADVREHLAQLAPAALARLEAYGLSERREAAWSLITSAMAPLAGFVVLDWPVAAAAVCLCLNLVIVLAGDWLRVLVSPSGLRVIALEATHDRFVFMVGAALARGNREIRSKWVPRLEELAHPRMTSEVLVLSPIGFGSALFTAWLIQSDEHLHAQPASLVLGSGPTLVLVIGALLFAMAQSSMSWRQTGSVRMQTAYGNGTLVMMVGMFTLMSVGMIVPDPMTTPEVFVVFACLAVAAVGVWRLMQLSELRRTADWLRNRYRAD